MARAPAIQESEALPEADRLDGAPHPRMTAKLYGHRAAEAELAAGLASGRLHHGWLVAGPMGIGKATLAYRFARAALSDPLERDAFGQSLAVSSETTGSRQVRALSHPGLLVIRRSYNTKDKRFQATIPVDEVRRLRQFLSLSADAGAWRVVIVDSADELNPAAANALLKSLEEPPPRTVFLVLVSEPGRLLPTIRSRCRILPLSPLAPTDLKAAALAALEAEGADAPTERDWPLLERLAEGSVRRALSLLAGGGLALQSQLMTQLEALPKVDWAQVHTLADRLAPAAAEQQFALFQELLTGTLARLIHLAATEAADGSPEARLAARLIGQSRLATFAELWETLSKELAEADALNLDRKALILGIFARLERVSRTT